MADMKLRECPMCGKEPDLVRIEPHTHKIAEWMPDCEGYDFIECVCGLAITGVYAWNKRTTDSTIEAQEAEIKRLREALERIAEGECNINHPPECCNCAVNIAQAALKEKE